MGPCTWSPRWDLNPRPPAYKAGALASELRRACLEPKVGLEPTTSRVRAGCSAFELQWACGRPVDSMCNPILFHEKRLDCDVNGAVRGTRTRSLCLGKAALYH